MTLELAIGWWALPSLITFISMSWAIFTPTRKGGDYSFDILPLFRLFASAIVSLSSWLVWALLK